MCGLTGFWTPSGVNDAAARALALEMALAIAHRGPDGAGVWIDAAAGLALAHRRLAILELSPAGAQPMISASGRYVIAFNGEIYNHLALRRELPEQAWRGRSDTETLLAAIEARGVEATLHRCAGMFAFALWDRHERSLTLARDRMGEKPLYYGWQQGVLLFGSELKALKRHPAFEGRIDRDALTTLLRHNAIPAPLSIYRDIRKLPPGCWLRLRQGGEPEPAPRPYWSLFEAAARGRASPFAGDEAEALARLEILLGEAVAGQMLADVPLGAFLSGGVDSSLVVALMRARADRPVRTFTIGFDETSHNEAGYARAVARHLGTDHTELTVTPREALEVIPRLPTLFDEPFADVSQIPTFLVARMTRQHVTVALSGDGGDELFGGYDRYLRAAALWRRSARIPAPLRRAIGQGLLALPPAVTERLLATLRPLFPAGRRTLLSGEVARQIAALLTDLSPESLYRTLISHWKNPLDVIPGATEPPSPLTTPGALPPGLAFEERLMFADALGYLPDDILVKLDRTAMGVSLESRVPMLDHRVVTFALGLPLSMKIRHGRGKWILRQLLARHLPAPLIDRPKMGFGVPTGPWLRGPLKEWAESLLAESRLRREGFFRPEPIRAQWARHLSGEADRQYQLWNVLMFQAWLEEEKRGRS